MHHLIDDVPWRGAGADENRRPTGGGQELRKTGGLGGGQELRKTGGLGGRVVGDLEKREKRG